MRNLFLGYYKPTGEEVHKLWKDAHIVLDANALLNIYSYSKQTRDTAINVLENIKDRLWLPHQFASEYQKNRLFRISQETKNIADVKTKIQNLLNNEIKSLRKHPFLAEVQVQQLHKICEALENAEKQHEQLLTDDPFQEKMAEIFNSKVGCSPNESEKNELHNDGKFRYQNRIPPGYCDYNEKNEEANTYGDYIGWRQVINHSKDKKVDIILVTDDFKEDWWLKAMGKRVGPRPELINEFNAESEGRTVHIHSVSSFLSKASRIFDIEISEEVIEEARAPDAEDTYSKKKLVRPKKSEADTPKNSSSYDGAERKLGKAERYPDGPKTTNVTEEG